VFLTGRGAQATVATYHVLAHAHDLYPIKNAWNEGSTGLSAVTFGAPSAMVVESKETTASLRRELFGNFHHVINPDDYIPFILNDVKTKGTKLLQTAATALVKVFPVLGPVEEPLTKLLEYWLSIKKQFAHCGSIYVLEKDSPRFRYCQITSRRQIPPIPDYMETKRFHAMSHYMYCFNGHRVASEPLSRIDTSLLLTPTQISEAILPQSTIGSQCICEISDDTITVSIAVRPRISQFFIQQATFKLADDKKPVTMHHFSPMTDGSDQVRSESKRNIFIILTMSIIGANDGITKA
jgi:hypothetical protein